MIEKNVDKHFAVLTIEIVNILILINKLTKILLKFILF